MADPTDRPKLATTAMGQAIKFAFKPPAPPAPTANPVADATAKRPSQGIAVVTDHAATGIVSGLFGAGAIAFAARPDLVGVALGQYYRLGIAIFGVLLIPGVPATFAASVAIVAPAVKAVLDLIRGFLPGKKE